MRIARPIIGIAVAAVAVVSVYVWSHHRRASMPAAGPEMVTAVKPRPAELPPLVPVNAPQMRTVAKGSAEAMDNAESATDWTAIELIVDTRASYDERLRAVESLRKNLTDLDWEKLREFLLTPDSADKVQNGQVIKNMVMDYLCTLNAPPSDLGDVLSHIYQDRKQDAVVRDYAVQHLGACYEQIAAQANNGKALQAVQKVLWQATTETSDSIGGTALLALKRLADEYKGFDPKKIRATALNMAQYNGGGELTHITAFQVCAQLSVTDALPVIEQAAQNGETIPVRISAIGALGQLGGESQVSFLKSVLDGPEDRLKPAARHALEQIEGSKGQLASRR